VKRRFLRFLLTYFEKSHSTVVLYIGLFVLNKVRNSLINDSKKYYRIAEDFDMQAGRYGVALELVRCKLATKTRNNDSSNTAERKH